jgi:hypothetical protein
MISMLTVIALALLRTTKGRIEGCGKKVEGTVPLMKGGINRRVCGKSRQGLCIKKERKKIPKNKNPKKLDPRRSGACQDYKLP